MSITGPLVLWSFILNCEEMKNLASCKIVRERGGKGERGVAELTTVYIYFFFYSVYVIAALCCFQHCIYNVPDRLNCALTIMCISI